MKFYVVNKEGNARVGKIEINGKILETPSFGFVATKGSLKALPSFLFEPKYGIVNTYHFFVNEAYKIIEENFKSIHEFSKMKRSVLLTDSGGFQVFSLGFGYNNKSSKFNAGELRGNEGLVKIKEEGVYFKDPISKQKYFLSPEISMEVQSILGAEFVVAFDECTHPLHSKEYTEKALERTNRWLERSAKKFEEVSRSYQELLPVNQGGKYLDLRIRSAKKIIELSESYNFKAYAIGGAFGESYGDSKDNVNRVLETVLPILNEKKESPIHLLGIGMFDDILNAVERGVDLFDCITPTKLARHGYVFTRDKNSNKMRLRISSSKFKKDKKPIDETCDCVVCKNYSRSFLWHQYKNNKLTYFVLSTIHNVHFMEKFFKEIREAIRENRFKEFKESILRKYFNKI